MTIIFLVITDCVFNEIHAAPIRIIRSVEVSRLEKLGAKEVARYVYLRTGKLLPVTASESFPQAEAIVVARKDRPIVGACKEIIAVTKELGPQQYQLRTVTRDGLKTVWIVGGDDVGTLYGVYYFLEKLGVRFYLHEDVIPDEKMALALPDLDEKGKPLFEIRGLNPWGTWVEGIDLWNTDQYKAVFTQITKMRMNAMMIHCYPRPSGVYIDPIVWIGLPDDIDEQGKVLFSSTTSQWNTRRSGLHYNPTKTSDYLFGGSLLFESDDWGSDVMGGQFPVATELNGRNEVFNRMGEKFNDAFTFARLLGVKTALGTEAGITNPWGKEKMLEEGEKLSLHEHGPSIVIPFEVQQRLKEQGKDPKDPNVLEEIYEGIFRRIARTHPLDYYVLYTQELWYWYNIDEQMFDTLTEEWKIVLKAWEKVKPRFGLVACGWILGPDSDHAAWDKAIPKHVAVSEMSQAYNAPVDEAFARIQGRQKWAIPWIEEDTPILTPSLWASRVRKDAADALAYGCTGLMTLHWRTRIVEPASSAMAQACWDQSDWNPEFGKYCPGIPASTFRIDEPVEGSIAVGYLKEGDIGDIPISETEDDKIYQTCRYQPGGYRLKVPNDKYRVVLKFCETFPAVNSVGARVFDVKLQNKIVLNELDIFAKVGKYTALDCEFDEIEVNNGWLKVELFMRLNWPCLMGLEVYGDDFTRKINVGGEDYKDYEGDLHWYIPTDTFLWGKRSYNLPPRGLNVDDFYADWSLAMFGKEVGAEAGKIFSELDGRIPLISTPMPGDLRPDQRYWKDVAREFKFVEKLEILRPAVQGAGNLDRFDYWLNTLRYTRAAAKARCIWGRLENALKEARTHKDAQQRKVIAKEKVLDIYIELVEQVGKAYKLQLATVSDIGGMGTVLNWEANNNLLNIRETGKELSEMLGEKLPAQAIASKEYEGQQRLIVPVVRSLLNKGESLKFKVIALDNKVIKSGFLYRRPLGRGEFNKINLKHVARAVYSVTLPNVTEDFEYYLAAETADGKKLIWPATAPQINQTVVVIE